MSREITVFLSGPITFALIAWVCFKIISIVFHAWAGAAIKGGAPICMTGRTSWIRELYPDHTGTGVL